MQLGDQIQSVTLTQVASSGPAFPGGPPKAGPIGKSPWDFQPGRDSSDQPKNFPNTTPSNRTEGTLPPSRHHSHPSTSGSAPAGKSLHRGIGAHHHPHSADGKRKAGKGTVTSEASQLVTAQARGQLFYTYPLKKGCPQVSFRVHSRSFSNRPNRGDPTTSPPLRAHPCPVPWWMGGDSSLR